jgi:hypothetical protein
LTVVLGLEASRREGPRRYSLTPGSDRPERRADRAGGGRCARIVLTGTGGGTWQTQLGTGPDSARSEGPVDVRIVVDAVDFCRLVANRKDPAAIATVVTGDGALAEDLFAAAASLALD